MKRLISILTSSVVICVALAGCSKKEDGQSSGAPKTPGSTVSSGSTVSTAVDGPPVDLKAKWVVGKKYSQHMEMESTAKMNINGSPMEQTMKVGSDYSIAALKEMPGGGYDLQMEFVGQKMESAMGGQTMVSFDSASDPANDARNPVAPLFRKMVGSQIHYETDASGHVQRMTGVDEMIEKMGGNTPQGSFVKMMFGEDTLKRYADLSQGLPDHTVKVGDTWPLKTEVPVAQIGTLILDLTYTFKGWAEHDGHKCAELAYTGTIVSKSDGAQPAGMSFKIENGVMKGTTWFDPELGTVIENSSEQNMEMKISPSPNQTISSVASQKTTLKLVSVTDIK